MKIKALLATIIIGAVTASGLTAGEWCPPDKGAKCPVDSCPDLGATVIVGYDSDYVWKGVRFARDSVWADVSYTVEDVLPVDVTIGIWHLSSLGSGVNGQDAYGDESNIYARASLPDMMGFTPSVEYVWYNFPNQNLNSFHQLGVGVSRDLFEGIGLNAGLQYFFGGGATDAWYYYAELGKGFSISDCIGVELTAGVAYVDGLWRNLGRNQGGAVRNHGWSHYYVKAALPIALNCRATLAPYVALNGSPDTWVTDGVNGGVPGANQNDIFYYGISLKVDF